MKPTLKMLELRYAEEQEGVQEKYEHIYDTNVIEHTDGFYQWILHLVKPEPGKRLLDVACGRGTIPALAAKEGVVAHGFDLSYNAVRAGDLVTSNLIVANGEHLPYPNNSFEYVTNIGSLEHYVSPDTGVREMARILTADGLACVLVPNSFSVSNMVHAWHNGRTADDGQPIQRYAARYEWQDLLEANGLEVVKTTKYDLVWPRSQRDVKRYLRHPKRIGWLFLGLVIPLNLANSFVYMCRKRP